MNTRTGGPAFSMAYNPVNDQWERGMTLRDYFAAKAMQSIALAALTNTGVASAMSEGDVRPQENYAKAAYNIADAMLKERAK